MFNKYNLKEGDKVILDANTSHKKYVIIDYFSPSKMFANVHSVEDENKVKNGKMNLDRLFSYEVLTVRLFPANTNRFNIKKHDNHHYSDF
jgi:bifunctional DNA-binding transcriptional regulator/antitoxin component of YhaV-PrlF toxin-antitoxin module